MKTLRLLVVVLKYTSPAVRALPFGSRAGSEAAEPYQVPLKVAREAAAFVSLVAALVALVAAAVALPAAAVALPDAAVALEAALVALVAALVALVFAAFL